MQIFRKKKDEVDLPSESVPVSDSVQERAHSATNTINGLSITEPTTTTPPTAAAKSEQRSARASLPVNSTSTAPSNRSITNMENSGITNTTMSVEERNAERAKYVTNVPVTRARSKEQIEESWRKTIAASQQYSPRAVSSVWLSPHLKRKGTGKLSKKSTQGQQSQQQQEAEPEYVLEIAFGLESIRGHRPTQEDSHVIKQPGRKPEIGPGSNSREPLTGMKDSKRDDTVPTMINSPVKVSGEGSGGIEDSYTFFGVFDGHGGDEAANFVSQRICKWKNRKRKRIRKRRERRKEEQGKK
jgi:hypothetical protein